MGIDGFWSYGRCVGKDIYVYSECCGQRLAVDGLVSIHQALIRNAEAVRFRDDYSGCIQYFMSMTLRMVNNGIIPVVVFDGTDT